MGKYIKHGTGPNDYKKGNRTRGENRRGNLKGRPGTPVEDQAGIIAVNAARAERAALYKEIAEQQKNVIKFGQDYALTLRDNLIKYIQDQEQKKKPLTVAGMIRASGLTHDTYYRYKNGKADHLLYQCMDENDIPYEYEGTEITTGNGERVLLVRLSDVIKMAELSIQEQREEACSSNRGNPAGNIFLLKAQQGLQDQPDQQQTNNTLNINVATTEEARDALRLLSQ